MKSSLWKWFTVSNNSKELLQALTSYLTRTEEHHLKWTVTTACTRTCLRLENSQDYQFFKISRRLIESWQVHFWRTKLWKRSTNRDCLMKWKLNRTKTTVSLHRWLESWRRCILHAASWATSRKSEIHPIIRTLIWLDHLWDKRRSRCSMQEIMPNLLELKWALCFIARHNSRKDSCQLLLMELTCQFSIPLIWQLKLILLSKDIMLWT